MPKMRMLLKVCGKGGKIEMNKKQYNNVIEHTLKYESSEYIKIKKAIQLQHDIITKPDFAHMQITLSARLAYKLDLDGLYQILVHFHLMKMCRI